MQSPKESTIPSNEELLEQIQSEAKDVLQKEPVLCGFFHKTILHETSTDLTKLLSNTICYRLFPDTDHSVVCPVSMRSMFVDCLNDTETLEMNNPMLHAIIHDIFAVCTRDPAMDTPLQVILYSKGFAALVCHRAGFRLMAHSQTFTALFLQSQASAAFGVDIHPAAAIGKRIMLDHGTGIVIGETATVGDGCTFLHGVTLGGTGKQHGDRHPKVGRNVLIGANASLLGNINIGNRVKIGAGSVVLRSIPDGATAVGVPAKIIGKASETKPGSDMDETLNHVTLFRNKSSDLPSMVTTSTTTTASDSERGYESEPATSVETEEEYDPTCPYREYAAMAKRAPPGSFTMHTLHRLLAKEGCKAVEIGSTFFALDEENKGYISMEEFHDRGYDCIVSKTNIQAHRVKEIMDVFWEDARQASKVPSLR